MKTVLLIGAHGQVGQKLRLTLAPMGDLVSIARPELDLVKPDAIRQLILEVRPDVIVNAAAYTAVDKAESEPDLAHAVNAIAPGVMAAAASQLKALLIHISTDYVFDGRNYTPYIETDTPAPTGVYGQTKLEGEKAVREACPSHVIIRTSWVYGALGQGNFVKTMLRVGASREEIRVVCDQIGTPTRAADLAEAIAKLIPKVMADPSLLGTYHFANSGAASWYDFAVAIFEEAAVIGLPLAVDRVVPITTPEYPTAASRPPYSVLACQKINGVLAERPPHWRQALRRMLTELDSQTH